MTFQIYSSKLTLEDISNLPQDLDLIIGAMPASQNGALVLNALNTRFPRANKHLATSCQGYFNQNNVYADRSMAIFGISDPEGSYGSAAGTLVDESAIRSLTYLLLETASLRAGRSGEVPQLIWLSASPGFEEQIIESIESFYNNYRSSSSSLDRIMSF